ncbi:transcriptional regulator, Crp/Fnr family [Faunimonas pinastri]|uniref:Transcriptional regulator, Crp/Fnr family n=1 Tax=Faunimonas pinastri TaxID=1855383 RepID=A0A1H9A7D7_9HYPH|nr:helix-turn-helix domain-containing protein [Faunimonas pinastri]SEP72393.1 transcriptional regulator, Crp/Fnr family [Faunimonas pinastri]
MLRQFLNDEAIGAPLARAPQAPGDLNTYLSMAGARMHYERNSEIFGENEAADYIYVVVSGAVRSCTLLRDGRRHIAGFHLPGDIFGLEMGGEHRFSAEAIGDSTILVIKRSSLFGLMEREPSAAGGLWAETLRDLQRAQSHMLLLARKNAQEKLAHFLLEMAERLSCEETLELPMCRQDIADYLGLTIETVSRMLTQLEKSGTIQLPSSRQVVLRDRKALHRLDS